LKQEQNIPGAVAASAKRCLCAIIHIENFQKKKSVKFIAEETKTLYLCGCSGTQTPPYCDGSNNCEKI